MSMNIEGEVSPIAKFKKKLDNLFSPSNQMATDEVQTIISLAVDNIIHDVIYPDNAPENHEHVQEKILYMLQFLENSIRTKDPEFRKFAVVKLNKLQSALKAPKQKLTQSTVRQVTPSAPSSEPNPEPKTAAQAQADEDVMVPVFIDTLAGFIEERLEAFTIKQSETSKRIPFLYCPEFKEKFIMVIRDFIAPAFLKSRRTKTLVDTIPVNSKASEILHDQFLLIEKHNVVRHQWVDFWASLRTALNNQDEEEEEDDPVLALQAAEKNKSLFGGLKNLTGKKAPEPVQKKKTPVEEMAVDIWEILVTPTQKRNYILPSLEDIEIFQALFQYPVEKITANTHGVMQMLEQEHAKNFKPGSSRDHMCRLLRTLPPYCGELIVVWAFFKAPDYFNDEILKSFLVSQGTTESIRRSTIPYLYKWVPTE
ncbi:MAG: hypothetical protein OQJ97_06720 [Rhodospirillales bacterium]|nr:hypothetical protein [Rhodospirillales bacterium]